MSVDKALTPRQVRMLAPGPGPLLGAFLSRRVSRLAAELDDEKRRLQAMLRDAELSVTAVFNTAYQRLSVAGKRCYRVLGLHPGTADLGIDVLAAAPELPEYDVRDSVDEMVAAGLVREVSDDRYLLHSLVRLHAAGLAESTDPAEDRDCALTRMLDFYRRGAVSAGHAVMPHRGWRELLFPDLLAGDHVVSREPWSWLETERRNLSAVVRTAYQQGELEQVCQLCVMLWPLHERSKYFEDLIRTNELGLAAARRLGDPGLEALLGIQLGFPYLHRGDGERAYEAFSAALVPARAYGHRALEATALESMGLARMAQGMLEESITLLRRNLDRKPFDRMQILEAIGDLAWAKERFGTARQRHGEALTIAESYGFDNDAERLRSKIASPVALRRS